MITNGITNVCPERNSHTKNHGLSFVFVSPLFASARVPKPSIIERFFTNRSIDATTTSPFSTWTLVETQKRAMKDRMYYSFFFLPFFTTLNNTLDTDTFNDIYCSGSFFSGHHLRRRVGRVGRVGHLSISSTSIFGILRFFFGILRLCGCDFLFLRIFFWLLLLLLLLLLFWF